jgi:UDP-GlcNAc:undecaprenyl-phosphate/decaprenyl-phosphate GlcNAc-1-phosphate transferase
VAFDPSPFGFSMIFFVLACVVPSFVISLCMTAAMRVIAPRIGLIDQPAARKVHKVPTPLGGGIGIVAGVVIPLLGAELAARFLLQRNDLRERLLGDAGISLEGVLERRLQLWWILGAGVVLSVMGLIDDRKNLHWVPRLIVQIVVACGLVFGAGVHATVFAPQPIIGQVLSVFWILVLVNSFNFLDNMDGLSAGIALIAATVLASLMLNSTETPHWLVAGLMLVLVGSLVGFLCHNWHPARIFMGDTGSYFIGLLMACATLLGTYYEYDDAPESSHLVLAPLCILAIPLYDFCSVMIIRSLQGRSPFHADKSHFSHRLVELGLRTKGAVLTVHLATLTTGLAALLLYRVHDWPGAILILALVVCILAIIAILETAGRKGNGGGPG